MTTTNATSSSDRVEAARKALAAHDNPAIEMIGADGYPLIGSVERAAAVIATLRALVEPPATLETPERITMQVYMGIHSFPVPIPGDPMRDLIARGVRAGIQAAWESWEPETAPGVDGDFVCAECGTTEAGTYVVAITDGDRTEVCSDCDDALREVVATSTAAVSA